MFGLFAALDIAVSHTKDRWRLPPFRDDRRAPWRRLLDDWRLPDAGPTRQVGTPQHQLLAAGMCRVCWWRWETGREIRHWACATSLAEAIDIDYQRGDD